MKTYVMIEPDYDKATVGMWCQVCLRPSVVKVPIVVITGEGVGDGGYLESCVDCQEGLTDVEVDCC